MKVTILLTVLAIACCSPHKPKPKTVDRMQTFCKSLRDPKLTDKCHQQAKEARQ